MTARVTRLAGALLLESSGLYFLIGNTKEPCDWTEAGFETPKTIDAVSQPFIPLVPRGEVQVDGLSLLIEASAQEGERLAQILATRFLIRRNGSVSERLWRIVTGKNEELGTQPAQETEAGWLIAMPDRIWNMIRDAALKCL